MLEGLWEFAPLGPSHRVVLLALLHISPMSPAKFVGVHSMFSLKINVDDTMTNPMSTMKKNR